MASSAPRNVIIFGETGAGKSSIVNMVSGRDLATISSGALGCTFESKPYDTHVDDIPFRLFDTAGLNEGDKGTVSAKQAVVNLYKLIRGLDNGVSLLMYCVRGPRIKDSTEKNYKMFHEAFCQQQVPIVIVVTGLENEENLDDWWVANAGSFAKYSMHFVGHACVTGTKGKMSKSGEHIFEAEYDESRKKVQKLIGDCSLKEPWRMERSKWFVTVLTKIWNMFASVFDLPLLGLSKVLYYALTVMGGVPKGEALTTTYEVERSFI